MVTTSEARKFGEDGKHLFETRSYDRAAELFRGAAGAYAELGDALNAAEQHNNLSVALLKLHRPQEALDAALNTDAVFAAAGDLKRQGMAVNNQAAALEDLGRLDEALLSYQRAADLLGQAGEGDIKAVVLQSAAALQLRRGKLTESGIRMIGVLESHQHPSLWQRILRFLVRLLPR
jgi:tetratricopeptide (TPR) repeat protein